eukprot:3806226-Karenia_brevis.AAC.1
MQVLEAQTGALEIRSDSQYVVEGCLPYRHKWKQQGWKGIDNVDLWQRVDFLLESKNPGDVLVTKVKGHATAEDVRTGVITATDRFGNHGADRLAVAGAALHAVERDVIVKAQARRL